MRIASYILTATAFIGMAGTPALFAGDFRHDYRNLARENADIRRDEHRLREDREDGRYRRAQCDRADLNRDLYRRERQLRDIRRDDYYRR